MPWPSCAPCYSCPEGGVGNRPADLILIHQPTECSPNSRQTDRRASPAVLSLGELHQVTSAERPLTPFPRNLPHIIAPPCTSSPVPTLPLPRSLDSGLGCAFGQYAPSVLRDVLSRYLQHSITVFAFFVFCVLCKALRCPASTIFADSCCLIQKCYRNSSTWGPPQPVLIPALQGVPPWAHQRRRRLALCS